MLKDLSKNRSLKQTLFACSSDMRHHVIYPDCDVKFTGHVTWVGKTSIEAKMHMSQVHTVLPDTHRCVDSPFRCQKLHRFSSSNSLRNIRKEVYIKEDGRAPTLQENSESDSCFSTVTELMLRSWMLRLSWWPEIQKTRGRNPVWKPSFRLDGVRSKF